MKTLTENQISDLERGIFNKGRDIDVALFNASNGGEKEFVVDALTLYVNSDGGFGQGLFIDNYNPASTAYTTYYALKIVYMYGLDDDMTNMLLKRAFTFLYHKAYQEKNFWVKAEPSNNNFAHHDDFTYPSNESLALTSGIIGLTLLLQSPTSPYYKLALKKYNLLKPLIDAYNFKENEVVDLAILSIGLKQANILDNNYDERISKSITLNNVLEISNYFNVKKEILEEAINLLIDQLLPVGMWENKKKWNNKYPEGDVAEIKWMGAISAENFYYIKKYSC